MRLGISLGAAILVLLASCGGSEQATPDGATGDGGAEPDAGAGDGGGGDGGGGTTSLGCVQHVRAGVSHACAISNGAVSCWGAKDQYASIVEPEPPFEVLPRLVAGLAPGHAIDLAPYTYGTCALIESGDVWCWGHYGDTPEQVNTFGHRFTQISGGERHVCGVRDDGTVWCLGESVAGEIGALGDTRYLVQVPGLENVVEVATGRFHTCARTATGDVWCMGSDDESQLGLPAGTHSCFFGDCRRAPARLTSIAGVKRIAAGGDTTCAINADDTVACWGSGGGGELGNGSYGFGQRSATPVAIGGVTGATQIAVADGAVCARLDDGTASCWGSNGSGGLGRDTPVNQYNSRAGVVAGQVTAVGNDVAELAVGGGFACALRAGGQVTCWGRNDGGQLGNGTSLGSATPIMTLPPSADQVELAVGSNHTCVRSAAGALRCWGGNGNGAVGTGSNANVLVPTSIGFTASSLALGTDASCAVKADHTLWCWGANTWGKLALPGYANVPTQVTAFGNNVKSVSRSSYGHMCVVRLDHTLACVGDNARGQLGRPSPTESNVPLEVTQLGASVASVVTAYGHTCALKLDGSVWCFGANSLGQLGTGSTSPSASSTPVQVTALGTEVLALSGGVQQTCALRTDHTVWCWGDGSFGRLGGHPSSVTPVQLVELGDTVASLVSLGAGCAIQTGGALWCWGDGPVGDGTYGAATTPVELTSLGPVAEVGVGGHRCVRKIDGSVWCWGKNESGALGDGTEMYHPAGSALAMGACP